MSEPQEPKVEFAGTHFDEVIGECVCCNYRGLLYAKLYAIDGVSGPILMCSKCWKALEDYEAGFEDE